MKKIKNFHCRSTILTDSEEYSIEMNNLLRNIPYYDIINLQFDTLEVINLKNDTLNFIGLLCDILNLYHDKVICIENQVDILTSVTMLNYIIRTLKRDNFKLTLNIEKALECGMKFNIYKIESLLDITEIIKIEKDSKYKKYLEYLIKDRNILLLEGE